MIKRAFFRVALAWMTLAFWASAQAATAQEQLQHFIASVNAADGAFTQTQIQDGKTTIQSGIFAFQRPGKFRWEVQKPYEQLVLSNGVHVFQYDPDLAQVIERGVDASVGASPAAILFGSAKLDDAFRVTALPATEGLDWLRATPRAGDAGFTHIDIAFAHGLPVRLLLADVFGQTTRIDLSAVQARANLPSTTFQFDIPAGVDVVQMP